MNIHTVTTVSQRIIAPCGMNLFCQTERHPGWAAWLQALGGLFLVVFAAVQLGAEGRREMHRRRQWIELCDDTLVAFLDRWASDFSDVMTGGLPTPTGFHAEQLRHQPELAHIAKIADISLTDWPRLDLYKSYAQIPIKIERAIAATASAHREAVAPTFKDAGGALNVARHAIEVMRASLVAYDAAANSVGKYKTGKKRRRLAKSIRSLTLGHN